MRKTRAMIGALALLAACGDPLQGVPRLAEVDLAETDATAQALPTDNEIAREGFFGTDAADGTVAEPLSPTAAAAETPQRPRGLLGLFRRPETDAPTPIPETPRGAVDAPATDQPERLAADTDAATETPAEPAPTAGVVVTPQPARPGFLGLFRRAPAPQEAETKVAALDPDLAAPTDPDAALTSAALPPEPDQPARSGLLSRLARPSPAEVNMPEVSYGTVLPYGVIARNCSAKRQALGRKVEGASGGFKLYDSNPRTTGPRTFYITGFDDGCPRQLTAAHVLLGAPSFYELLHYGPAGAHLKVGETDKAYERVKARVCGVSKGRPCGSKMRALERSTFFVNAYPRADDNTAWSELLIHGGEVVATAKKSSS